MECEEGKKCKQENINVIVWVGDEELQRAVHRWAWGKDAAQRKSLRSMGFGNF